MVLDYYKLREQPFGVTPDERYLYASATHREALASLLYGLEAERGFVALIAEPGMGKTTLLHSALRRIQDRARTAFLFQTIRTPEDFLRALLGDLGIKTTSESSVELQERLNGVLVEQARLGKPLVIFADEAQNLDQPVLELLRMLSNFETAQAKLLQIVLAGQPQLAEKLASPGLVQLRQRVSIVARLKPFSPEETARYVDHRLQTAGYSGSKPLFTRDALRLIAEQSQGIPRNINNLCFNALSLGCALKKAPVDEGIVREVIGDLDLEPLRAQMPPAAAWKKSEIEPRPHASAAVHPWRVRWGRILAFSATIPFVLVAALLLGALLRSHPWASAEHNVEAAAIAPEVDPANVPALEIAPDPTPAAASAAAHPKSVQVAPGETLYRICVNSFGRCDAEILHEFQELNPMLRSLNHLEPGWIIRIPQTLQAASRRAGAALLREKRTP